MSIAQAVRAILIIGIVGCIASLLSTVIQIIFHQNDEPLALSILDIVSMTMISIGLIASYLIQSNKLGKFGFIGFILCLAGLIFLIASMWAFAFAQPVLTKLDPSLKNAIPPNPLNGGIIGSGILTGVGLALYGLSLIICGKIARWSGVPILIGAVAWTLSASGVAPLFIATAVLVPVGFLWLFLKASKSDKATLSA